VEDGLGENQGPESGLSGLGGRGGTEWNCLSAVTGLAAAGVMMMFPCPGRTGLFVE
jgi:hypothetical protein